MTLLSLKICQRIRQLFRLIGSSNANEAASAREKLVNLLTKHRLSWNDIPLCIAEADAADISNTPKGAAPSGAGLDPEVNVLDLVLRLIELHFAMTPEDMLVAALWALHCHVLDHFDHTPRLDDQTKLPTYPPSNAKPQGWSDDELSKFLDRAHQNQYATFAKKRDAMTKLIAIDAQFAKVTKGWLNPQNEIVAMLFIRCHGAYRTACGFAMSGQAAECYVQCRTVLEYAAYAVHINRNPSLGKVWLDRHHSDEADPSCRKRGRTPRNFAQRGANYPCPCR